MQSPLSGLLYCTQTSANSRFTLASVPLPFESDVNLLDATKECRRECVVSSDRSEEELEENSGEVDPAFLVNAFVCAQT